MNLESRLLAQARQLKQPPADCAEAFEAVRDELAETLNRELSARPDLDRLIGPGNLAMMQDNSRNFCRFMSAMFKVYEPDILVQTVLWVFRAYRAHGFQTCYWPASLDTFVQISQKRLQPETYAAIDPFLQWLIVNIPVFVAVSDLQRVDPAAVEPEPGSRTG